MWATMCHVLVLYLGIFSGQAGSGQVKIKSETENGCPSLA
jgi:hypothetical protein